MAHLKTLQRVYSPDMLDALSAAFDLARSLLDTKDDDERRTLALTIFRFFDQGERNPARLSELARSELACRECSSTRQTDPLCQADGAPKADLAEVADLAGATLPYLRGRCRTTVSALQMQRRHYEAVLDKISQGVCFFDGEQRLVLSNRLYAEMYGLRPEDVRPGSTLREIAERRVAAGTSPARMPEEYVAWCLSVNRAADRRSWAAELADGRTFHICHQPMPDGGWIATHDDISDRVRCEAQIKHMAFHDVLTGLPNREALLERLGRVAGRPDERSAVLCLDLDYFKDVNDMLGHATGDRLLQEVVSRISGQMRGTDTLARVGGDEFVIVLNNVAGPEMPAALAERIVDLLAKPFDLDGSQSVTGVSIGIVLYCGADGKSPEHLLRNGDMALHRAKAEGRGTYRFFERDMDAAVQERRVLDRDIRCGLAEDQFEVHYQPKVDARKQRITGVEALVRWRHPARGLVLPDRFIPFSEENGLIGQIGEHVLRTACARSVGWAPLKLAVNLSPIQVRTPRLPDLIANILIETGFEAQHLELEITENTLLEDTDTVLSTLGSLKALGVTIAMDDFGIGYSSLGYLRRFPFDRLKIDRSFVKDIGDDPHSGAIAKAVIAMGHSLGIATTAEGVETPMQAKILRRLGCHELQGFLFGRPMPADDFERFVGNQEAARKARRQRPSRLRDGHYSPPHAEPIGRRNEAR